MFLVWNSFAGKTESNTKPPQFAEGEEALADRHSSEVKAGDCDCEDGGADESPPTLRTVMSIAGRAVTL